MRPERPAPAAVRRAVGAWSRRHQRPLPWRGERDPYRVHVSEVMLQQTQTARVAVVYPVFVRTFPTVERLAEAPDADVLRVWGDLGYPRRAVNLWKAARMVVDRGSYPRTVRALEALPGVGPYTARALASFAFQRDVGVVEANIRRLLRRLHGAEDIDEQAVADALVPEGRSAWWNQALMDLAAEVCRPRAPRCDECPLRPWCAWAAGVRPPERARPPGPPFEATMRYARGRVLRELRASSPLTVAEITRRTGLATERARAAVDTLAPDELVSLCGDRVSLGGAQRARERSRATSATT